MLQIASAVVNCSAVLLNAVVGCTSSSAVAVAEMLVMVEARLVNNRLGISLRYIPCRFSSELTKYLDFSGL